MIEPVIDEKGDMINYEITGGGDGRKYSFILIVCFVTGFLGFLGNNEKSLAQVSQGAASFVYTGSAIPASGFTPVLLGKGLQAGPFQFHPFLGVAEVYTDNVFRQNTGRQSDFIHVVVPGMQIKLPFAGYHQAVLDYRASKWIHQKFSRNDATSQNLTGQVLFNFPGGMNLHLQGGLTKGFDFRGSAVDVQALEPTKWNTKNFLGEARTIGNRVRVGLRVRVNDLSFDNNNQAPARDRISSQGDFTVLGSIAPKTFALLSFGLRRTVYDQNTQLDNASFRVSTGLRWKATGKTTGEIKVGYEVLNFDHAPVTQPAGSLLSSGGSRREIIRVTGDLNWQATARSSIRLRPFRTIRQSGILNTSTFTQSGFNLNASQRIGVRTTLNGNFGFSHNDFSNDAGETSTANRVDMQGRGGLGVSYQAVRWLGIRFNYLYTQRYSTIGNFENYANTLMVSIQGVF